MTLADYQRKALELQAMQDRYINHEAMLTDLRPGFDIAVRIIDVRALLGRIDVKVTPVAGVGDTWVSVNRIILKAEG